MNTVIEFELNKSCGFFSVFFFLCKSYIYSKQNNIPFYINHNNWPYLYKLGWHDYFDSLNTLPSDCKNTNTVIKCKHLTIPHYFPRYTNEEYISCIKEIFILKPFIIDIANEYIKNVLNDDYISIYVRRGDKFTETKFISEEDICKKINLDISKNIFIQTDDYTVVENFKKILPNHKIFCRLPENKRGHYQNYYYLNRNDDKNIFKLQAKSFNDISDINYIFNDTIELLSSIYISSKAHTCWVDYSSNVARFIKLFSFENTYSYNTDIPVHIKSKVEPFYNI
jgi:hypothetical protein